MASSSLMLIRGISTTSTCQGKRNFRKFLIYGKRGSKIFKENQIKKQDNPELPIDKRGVRDVGYRVGKKFVIIPEMVPEIIVPSLEGFKLKPYVTYESQSITQSEFTVQDLFNTIYASKIIEDFENAKLTANGEPLDPSKEEMLTPKEAKINAAKTGTDLFTTQKEEVIKKYNEMIENSKVGIPG